MKHRKYTINIIVLLLLTVTFSSCKNKDETNLQISLNRTEVSRLEQSVNLTIRTYPINSAWTITVEQEGNWCVAQPLSGTSSSAQITVFRNVNDVARTAKITVKFGKHSKTVSLTQKGTASSLSGIEIPEIRDSNWFIQHNYYSLEFDTAQRTSIWLAYVFNNEFNLTNTSRPPQDPWQYDPQIPRQYQWAYPFAPTDPPNYRNFPTLPGWDRGHLVASADRLFSREANDETFYISNISPQVGVGFNRDIWENLESKVRRWARAADCDTLYVVTGVAINKPGTIYHVNGTPQVFGGVEILGRMSNRNNVTIAKYWYKALVKRKGDEFTGIAWWFENKRHTSTTVTNYDNAMSIRELEHLTGINFFPKLKTAIPGNPQLEEQVETTFDINKWPL
ncbi:MAG: DNA/RNA non-specific endonuclease [Bacteroidales bacterium]|jgi:endonuclease G|nr:DNA/RNA non-specific endonuclease [Bacteroidales bacterium]